MSAGRALRNAAAAALEGVGGIGRVSDAGPVQAAFPYAVVEAGPESDWGHKTGAGREVRLAAAIRDGGESPMRVEALGDAAEAALAGLGGVVGAWRIVSLAPMRRRLVREARPQPAGSGPGWALVIEFRVRLLAET